MKVIDNYFLNYDTYLFHPNYDKFGKLITAVLGNKGLCFVDMQPSALINYNLNYYGSSLVGAIAGAKSVLGKVKMPPIIVNKMLGIYWFPTKAVESKECIWIALHHIKDSFEAGKGKTKVVFTNGRSITIDISLYSFNKRVQRAYELKGKIESRTKALENQTFGQQQYYSMNEMDSEHAFEINSMMHNKQMEFSIGMDELKL